MKIRPFWLRYTTDPIEPAGGAPSTDTPPANPAPVIEPPADQRQEAAPKPEEKLGEPGKAALNAERKARRDAEKALAAMQAKVAEFEQRDMSEQEKLAQQLAEAQAAAAKATTEALRLRIAQETGLDPDLHEFLDGITDEDQMRARAQKLAAKGQQPTDFGAGQRGQKLDPLQDMQRAYDEAVKAGDVATQVTLMRRMSALKTKQ